MTETSGTAMMFLRIFEMLKMDHQMCSETFVAASALVRAVTETNSTIARNYQKHHIELTKQRLKTESELIGRLDEAIGRLKDAAGLKTDV